MEHALDNAIPAFLSPGWLLSFSRYIERTWERVFIMKVFTVLAVGLSVFFSVLTCVV